MILLTGATGTIGSELARLLSKRENTFRAYVRNPKKARDLNIPHMDIFEGDLRDTKALDRAMLGISRVFLLSSPDPMQVELQGNVVRAAKKAHVSLIVKQSAFGAGADSPVALARWHWMTEEDIRKSGVPYAILRPMMFMQNLLMLAHDIGAEGLLRVPMGTAKSSLIDARDIARCAAEILTGEGHAGKTYELTGPEAISYAAIAEALSEVCGRRVTYVDTPLEEVKAGMIRNGLPKWLADDICKLYEIFATGRAERVTTAVADITGSAATDIRQFCRDYSVVFTKEVVHH